MLLLGAQSWIWHSSPASGVSQGWHSSTAQAASWLQKYCSWVSKYTENSWRTSDFRTWACVACKINMLFFSNCTATFQNRSFLSPLLDMVTREELTYTTEGKMLQTSGLLQHNIYVWHLVQGTEVLLLYPVCSFTVRGCPWAAEVFKKFKFHLSSEYDVEGSFFLFVMGFLEGLKSLP